MVLKRIWENLGALPLLVRKYGIFGLLRLIFTDILFDLRHGVDTYSAVPREELFSGERLELQNRYVPSTFRLVEIATAEAKEALGEEFSSAHFLDYGSGKGKVLIGAVRNGFTHVTGVEYSSALHEISTSNLGRLNLSDRARSIHGDAADFYPSPDDRVIYFFHPFEGHVLEKTLENIKSVQPNGKRVLLLFTPDSDETFVRYFERVSEKTAMPGKWRYNVYVG